MKQFKLLKNSLIALAVAGSFSTLAESVAITNTTVYTGTEQGVLTEANVVIDKGKVVAVNPANLVVDRTVDGQGRILTAGFIAPMTRLGLVEVGAVARSRDASPKKGGITFDPSLAFNPESSLIPFARKGGITHSVVVPGGSDDMIAGQAFVVNLSGDYTSVEATGTAVLAEFGAASKDSRASNLQSFKDKLEAHVKKQEKAKKKKKDDKDKDKEPSKEEKLLTAMLKGELPVIAEASRATDILHLIKLKEQFGLNLVLSWASDAVRVKEQLAAAKVPVIINPMNNLPGDFDSLHSSLENAAKLEKAGVKVLLSNSDSHMMYNLRLDAGNAISNGMSVQGALEAVTSNVAEVFGMKGGTVAKGEPANLVLWSGDPFEISTKVETMWINGEQITTESRQDKLRDRYTAKDDKRRGYIK